MAKMQGSACQCEGGGFVKLDFRHDLERNRNAVEMFQTSSDMRSSATAGGAVFANDLCPCSLWTEPPGESQPTTRDVFASRMKDLYGIGSTVSL